MAKGKKASRKHKSQSTPTSTSKGGQSSLGAGKSPRNKSRGGQEASGPLAPSLSLRDAARNVGQTPSFWDPSNMLRHKGVSFVSGGTTGDSFLSSIHKPPVESSLPPRLPEHDRDQSFDPKSMETVPVSTAPTLGFEASVSEGPRDRDLTRAIPKTQRSSAYCQKQIRSLDRSSSPTPSNSSEEVVVFTGRNHSAREINMRKTEVHTFEGGETTQNSRTSRRLSSELSASPQNPQEYESKLPMYDVTFRRTGPCDSPSQRAIVEEKKYKTPVREPCPRSEVNFPRPRSRAERRESEIGVEEMANKLPGDCNMQQSKNEVCPGRRTRGVRVMDDLQRRKRHRKMIDEGDSMPEDAMEDYIENLKASGALDDALPDAALSLDKHGVEWGPTELEDFADLSTSEEPMKAVSHVLSKRERASGPQYLVVRDGQSIDEARWIHKTALNANRDAHKLISEFEGQREADTRNQQKAQELNKENLIRTGIAQVIVGSDGSADDDSEGIDEGDVYEDYDSDIRDAVSSLDEMDLIQRRKERMTDEHIARLLQKQEELGFVGDELLLFDEEGEKKVDGPNPLRHINHAKHSEVRTKHQMMDGRRTLDNKFNHDFDGEDYGSFDIMDWGRPSLFTVNNGASCKIAGFGLSDSELERSLAESWALDRSKKKAKRMEREQLRSRGQLSGGGRKRKNADSANRARGFTMNELEDELENFLGNDRQQLTLPPMDKKTRKAVHEIANRFGLKSKSAGSGSSRFPTLAKTSRTRRFDAFTFDRLEERLSKRFGNSSSKRGDKNLARAASGNFNVRDGELVGAGAAEIGSDNKGRLLLEKMGWTKGTALGAIDNKGILMPIDHVVKKTRTGLGK